ncbi:MAG: hypothetical protein O8C60_00340 [Candidatus Methanoperedens sp.]|nr:hypothetical protein [Candidatus Methanoperedens sp.]
MKYLYGDSTELPLQRDFLGLLDNYIDISVKSITIENAVFDLKETIKDRRGLKNSVLDEMDNFVLTVETAISGAVSRSKEQEMIVKYADKSKDFLKKFIEDGKTKFSEEIFREINEFEKKVKENDEFFQKILALISIRNILLSQRKTAILRRFRSTMMATFPVYSILHHLRFLSGKGILKRVIS